MSSKVKILAFAGSLRKDSYNKKIVQIAAAGARAAGADVTYLDLRDLPLPVFDQDLEAEQGLHPNARKLKDVMLANQGFLIAAPEYNSSITAALKNAIDWASRPAEGEKTLECFQGKVAGLMSASPGALGGLRGLVHVRSILGSIGVLLIPHQVAVSRVHEAIAADGSLIDKSQQAAIEKIGAAVSNLVACLAHKNVPVG